MSQVGQGRDWVNPDQLAILVQQRPLYFSCMNLSEANFRGMDLAGTDFSWALLYDADLSYTNLRGCDFNDTWFDRANLTHADLTGADLGVARFEGSDLSYATLKGAKLECAVFVGVILTGVDVAGLDFTGVGGLTAQDLLPTLNLEKAILPKDIFIALKGMGRL